MSRFCAPSAVRTPISRDRWATPYERTPKRPAPAIAAAKQANAASTTAYSRGFASARITRSSIVMIESIASDPDSSRTAFRTTAAYGTGSPADRTTITA